MLRTKAKKQIKKGICACIISEFEEHANQF